MHDRPRRQTSFRTNLNYLWNLNFDRKSFEELWKYIEYKLTSFVRLRLVFTCLTYDVTSQAHVRNRHHWRCIYSGAPAARGRQAEPHTHIRELKGTHEMIFSCVPWLAVLLVGAYARRRRRRRRRWSRATWRPYSNNRLTETCSLGLSCTSLISDIHVIINLHLSK